ncbi:hypothetical protein B0A55_08190 [Friedmanniomyces simplex]|uniref:Uncharacterized protein n=1 Tax=Friedmanniomyces simplex TaxID=329884 RepID=A0A4U0WYQ3_9PEZI|nr:hypothetical protein B0A55_08190 [Friedmanniomyces simplex]
MFQQHQSPPLFDEDEDLETFDDLFNLFEDDAAHAQYQSDPPPASHEHGEDEEPVHAAPLPLYTTSMDPGYEEAIDPAPASHESVEVYGLPATAPQPYYTIAVEPRNDQAIDTPPVFHEYDAGRSFSSTAPQAYSPEPLHQRVPREFTAILESLDYSIGGGPQYPPPHSYDMTSVAPGYDQVFKTAPTSQGLDIRCEWLQPVPESPYGLPGARRSVHANLSIDPLLLAHEQHNENVPPQWAARPIIKDEEAEQPPIYFPDDRPDAGSAENTIDKVYPTLPPLDYDNDEEEDDFLQHLSNESYWAERFIEAANNVYVRPDESAEPQDAEKVADRQRKHDNAVKQQEIYNYKPHEASSKDFYTNDWVNTRMRLLFRAVLTYHQGGRSTYPIGGNNNGYGEDRKMKFTARLGVIIDAMQADKRVVMDVIEGRGVAALAMNPKRFADRKNSNNKCNENKKRKLDLVGDVPPVDGIGDGDAGSVRASSATPSVSRRRRRRGV